MGSGCCTTGGATPDHLKPPVGADCTRVVEERRQHGDEDSGGRGQQWGGGEGEGSYQQVSLHRNGERRKERGEGQMEEKPGSSNQGRAVCLLRIHSKEPTSPGDAP